MNVPLIRQEGPSLWKVWSGESLLGSALLSVIEEEGRSVKSYLVLSAEGGELGTTGTLEGAKRLITGEPVVRHKVKRKPRMQREAA